MVVIAEVMREVLIGIGELFVRSIDGLRKEKKSYGAGTTATHEIKKRQSRRQATMKGTSNRD
jgi:hypothetical protein